MAASKRSAAVALAISALALTTYGLVFAATDSNPSGQGKDLLVLNGYPPKSANLLVTVSTGQGYNLTADVNVNFDTNAVEATVEFPLVFSMAAIDLRLVDNHLYARSAGTTSGKWLAVSLKEPALYGLSLELTKPDIPLIKGFTHVTVTRSGYTTTHDYSWGRVAVSNVLGGSQTTGLGSLNWSISTGSQGEITQSTLDVKTKHAMTEVSAVVLSYNHQTDVAAPAPGDVQSVTGASMQKLVGSTPFLSLLMPANISSLGQAKLS